jgi:hypothetical protein
MALPRGIAQGGPRFKPPCPSARRSHSRDIVYAHSAAFVRLQGRCGAASYGYGSGKTLRKRFIWRSEDRSSAARTLEIARRVSPLPA